MGGESDCEEFDEIELDLTDENRGIENGLHGFARVKWRRIPWTYESAMSEKSARAEKIRQEIRRLRERRRKRLSDEDQE